MRLMLMVLNRALGALRCTLRDPRLRAAHSLGGKEDRQKLYGI